MTSEKNVESSTPSFFFLFFFYVNTCEAWLIRFLSRGKAFITLCSCGNIELLVYSCNVLKGWSKINETTALHFNIHIIKMLTDILQLFVWIKSLVCLAAVCLFVSLISFFPLVVFFFFCKTVHQDFIRNNIFFLWPIWIFLFNNNGAFIFH